MVPERRRSPRVAVDGDGSSGVVRAAVPVELRDISVGGLRFALDSCLEAGGVYPLTALLRGLSLATPIRITRCARGSSPTAPASSRGSWEAAAEFLWRDDDDAAAVRRWLGRRVPVAH